MTNKLLTVLIMAGMSKLFEKNLLTGWNVLKTMEVKTAHQKVLCFYHQCSTYEKAT